MLSNHVISFKLIYYVDITTCASTNLLNKVGKRLRGGQWASNFTWVRIMTYKMRITFPSRWHIPEVCMNQEKSVKMLSRYMLIDSIDICISNKHSISNQNLSQI